MNYNEHYNIKGFHAFLSPSQNSWINDDDDKLVNRYIRSMNVARGTKLHALACDCITLGVKLPRNKKTLNSYVNDAIGFRMRPEQILYFSENCFGTADAILFDEHAKLLRVHDLKTGTTPAGMTQLEIYAALFCLEYRNQLRYEHDIPDPPFGMSFELRIYQNNEIKASTPDSEWIKFRMDQIEHADSIVNGINVDWS